MPLLMTQEELSYAIDDMLEGMADSAAKSGYKFTAERGIHWYVMQGNECVLPPAECDEYDSIEDVKQLLKDYPRATEIGLDLGLDGADSKEDFDIGDYDPWVENETIEVWTKE